METLRGGQGIDLPSSAASEVSQGNRFRPTLWSAMQARRIRLWLALVGKGLLRINLEVEGKDNVPPGEPLIVAAAPHRSWIDPFVLLLALPSLPRLYFLGAADGPGNRWWKRLAIEIAGGMVPVTTRGHLNREALELSLAILANDNRVGIFPEGWGDKPDPEILPLKRGVAFLSEHSGRRVLPVAIAGNLELWRGCTIRVAISPPLPVLAPGADRVAEQAFTDHLRDTLIATMPPAPAAPPPDARPWRWLTRLI